MTELWWPEASRRDLCPTSLAFTGGPAEGVIHTTEGATYAGALAAYRAHNSWAHFTLSFEASVFAAWQHIPIDHAARSLVNAPGGVSTNTDHVIQIEVVAFAGTIPTLDRRFLAGIRRCMRWVESVAGVGRHAPAFKAYPASYGADNGVRMSPAAWDAFGGWCGHQHVPENVHGDPGAIDIAYLLDLAPAPSPSHLTEDDMPPYIAWSDPADPGGSAAYLILPAAGVRVHLSPVDLDTYRAMGLKEVHAPSTVAGLPDARPAA
jgi:hypothetical protein